MALYVTGDSTIDDQLQRLGLRRTGVRGYPLNGQLYLGRGVPGSSERGIYRSTRKELPRTGFSAADVFEFLEVTDPQAGGAAAATEMSG